MTPPDPTPPALPALPALPVVPRVAWAVLAAVLLATMAWALPRHIQPGDAGEFSTVLLRGGVPHPPGYPWMRMLGPFARLGEFAGLPAATAAALPCALLGIGGWLWLGASAARLCPWPPALTATALLGCSHVVVLHGCDAEVWGPLVFATAALVHLAVTRRRPPWQIGVVFGAALAVHLTALWLAPLAVLAVWPPTKAGPRGATLPLVARRFGAATAGGVGGLAVFATLAIGDVDAPWRWGELDSVGGVLRHVLRSDYGTFSLSLHDADVSASDQLGRAASSSVRAWTAGLLDHPAWAPVLLVAFAGAAATTWPRDRRGLLVAIAASWSLAAVVFPLMHDVEPRSAFGAWILERFDLMPLAISTLPFAVALAAVWTRVRRGWPRVLAAVTAAGLVAQQLATTGAAGIPADDDAVEVYAIDLLRTPDPSRPAIVIGTDDHRTFAVLFAQTVLGEGAKVVYIDASLLAHPWYRAALRRRMPTIPDDAMPVRMLTTLWSQPESRDVPVYLANDFSRPSTSLPRVPEGVLWRVLPPHGMAVSPDEVLGRHLAAMQRLVGPPTSSRSPFAADLAAAWGEPDARLRAALQRRAAPGAALALPASTPR